MMRLQLPVRVSLPKSVAFAGVLVVIQQFQHTSLVFSLLFFAVTVLSAVNFNLAGGFSRASGAYVFFLSTLAVIFGVFWKSVVGEAADSNLETPIVTMACYAAAEASLILPILINRRLTGRAPGLGPLLGSDRLNLFYSAIGCMTVGILIFTVNAFAYGQSGKLLSAINQINAFLPLGIILATVDVVQKSNGRRSVNLLSGAGFAFSLIIGVLAFSKQGMFTPFVAWIVGVTYAQLRVRWIHVVAIVASAALAVTVLTPLSQVGRGFQATTYSERASVVFALLGDFSNLQRLDAEPDLLDVDPDLRHGYFSHSVGLAGRLSMISPDDAMISYTEQHGTIGYAPIRQHFADWIPRFLAPNKDTSVVYNGNYYAHEVGGYLGQDDFGTGISFSPIGEAYHVGGWGGIFLLMPALWLLLFIVTDLVCGDLRRSPWGMLAVLLLSHVAPEGLAGGVVYFTGYSNFGLAIAILFCVYVAPVIGSVFGTSVVRTEAIRVSRRGQTLIAPST